MTDAEKDKIKRFTNDVVLSGAVKKELERCFTKKRQDRDVHILAAQTLAVEFLNEAFADMERFKQKEGEERRSNTNIAL